MRDYQRDLRFLIQRVRVSARASILWKGAGLLLFFVAGCTTVPTVQPQVNNLVIAGRYDQAVDILDKHAKGYGPQNQLLYKLDRGLVLHFAGRYRESIAVLAEARQDFYRLFSQSLTQNAASMVWNDYAKSYRGEDFERVLINIFQAMNYVALGEIDEALVEARDVDSALIAINRQYRPDQRNVYKEDAFARFLMGVIYEADGSSSGWNDAFIAYRNALEIYEQDYQPHYQTKAPSLLKENLVSMAEFMGNEEWLTFRQKFPDAAMFRIRDKRALGEIYLIQYHGLSPVKQQDSLTVPLPDGYLTQIAFPRYEKRSYDASHHELVAEGQKGQRYRTDTQLGEDIEAIAIRNLADRKLRVMAWAVTRPAAKWLLEKTAIDRLEEKAGKTAGYLGRLVASLYNVYSEQADLRSWQTLPAQIRLARLVVPPGEYDVSLSGKALGRVTVQAGRKYFLLARTVR